MHEAGLHPDYAGETHQRPAGQRALLREVASSQGGDIPVDRSGLRRIMITSQDRRYLNDPSVSTNTEHSLPVAATAVTACDAVFRGAR